MRAQTTLDFVIGVSIFLAIVLFTFGFVPGILAPFDVSDGENPSIADRTADSLSKDLLGSPEDPNVLDRYCTVAFFEEGTASPDGCAYEGTSVSERLNFPDLKRVNITFTRTGEEPVCWADGVTSPNGEPGLTENCTDDDVLLTGGSPLPETDASTITSRRTVALHGQSVTMEVTIW